jgi:hypothetical protein
LATGYGLDSWGSISGRDIGLETCFGPTQNLTQWVPVSPGVKRPGREADPSPPSSAYCIGNHDLHFNNNTDLLLLCDEDQVKLFLLEAAEARRGCETSRLPHFPDNRLTDGGEVMKIINKCTPTQYLQTVTGVNILI